MPFSDEFIQQWEHIIEQVNKTEVPLECIKKVVIKLGDRRQKTIIWPPSGDRVLT